MSKWLGDFTGRWYGFVLIMLVITALVVVPLFWALGTYVVDHHTVLVKGIDGPTIEKLFAGDPPNRVWPISIGSVMIGGNSYIEVVLATRHSEVQRATDFLNRLGIWYIFRPGRGER